MGLDQIDALIWRVCGVQDVRALLGRGGGHEVIAFDAPDLWRSNLELRVRPEGTGGTLIPVADDTVPGRSVELAAYLHTERNEVRLKVPPIRDAGLYVYQLAHEQQSVIDPDGTPQDQLVVFVVKTTDGNTHLRGQLASTLIRPLSEWVLGNGNTTGGRKLKGIPLDDLEQRVWVALMKHKVVLLYGPPGTGKTRLMLRIRNAFEHGIAEIGFDRFNLAQPFRESIATFNLPTNRKIEFVTFHQSLTYENFIIGLRPVPMPRRGGFDFRPTDGIFLKLAAEALKPDSAALLLIDEINRGNVADIFGELITVVEADKRLGSDNKATQGTVQVMLPFKPESPKLKQEFEMPYHFYLLASMNSLDRSVAPLDSAIRRRFRQVPLVPNLDLARRELLGTQSPVDTLSNPATEVEAKSLALAILERLNDGIRGHWGPEFLLGHSYILGVQDAATLIEACSETILPQLFELYRDRPGDLAEVLGLDVIDSAQTIARRSGSGATAIDFSQGSPLELLDLRTITAEDGMRRLFSLAYRRSGTAAASTAAATTDTATASP